MQFLVVGHLCFDVIHRADRPDVRSYGGIYYAVATLASLLGVDDRVIPVFGVHTSDYDALIGHFARFRNIDTSGIFTMDAPTNQVHLFYRDAESRMECSKDIAPPIPFENIRRSLAVDGVLLNMISGSDVTIETVDAIRMAVRPRNIPIHFDFHSLTLGVNEKHERFRRPVADWRRWAFMMDMVQLNEEEIAGLSVERMDEKQTVGHLLTLGTKGVLVTRSDKGASVFTNDRKHVLRRDVEAPAIGRAEDATGCGDVFGAAFLVSYVRTSDMMESARFANRVAATKAGLVGADQMLSLKQSLAVA